MPFNNFNPPFRQQHKIQRCSLVQIVKSFFHVSTHSPKDIQTSVIYWGISGVQLHGIYRVWVYLHQLKMTSDQKSCICEKHKLCPGFISKCILQKIFELCIGAAETKLKHTYTWTHTLSRSLISTISSQSSGLPGGGRRQIQTEEEMGKKGVLDREDWTRQFSAPRGWTCMAGLIG